jgi:CRP/FNR family cyclic AMP-dependent transcriptional regulator
VLSDVPVSGSVSLASALGAAWLTNALTAEARAALVDLGRVATLPPGYALTREGDPTDHCAIVLEGRVALRMRVPERGMVTILTVEPGDIVGWSAVVPPYRATSSAITLASTTLALFDGPRLRDELARNKELAAGFYPLVLAAVGRRLEGTRLQLLDLFGQRWTEPW